MISARDLKVADGDCDAVDEEPAMRGEQGRYHLGARAPCDGRLRGRPRPVSRPTNPNSAGDRSTQPALDDPHLPTSVAGHTGLSHRRDRRPGLRPIHRRPEAMAETILPLRPPLLGGRSLATGHQNVPLCRAIAVIATTNGSDWTRTTPGPARVPPDGLGGRCLRAAAS